MKLKWHLLLFVLIFAVEASVAVWKLRNAEPRNGDAAEVHNIAWNLAHGRGYQFNWNDTAWRRLWQSQNHDGRFDFIVERRGGPYPTLSRPPLMPILVAGILRVVPHASFVAWRLLDSVAFAAAACLLLDVAFVHGGFAGFTAMLVIILIDPWRRGYIPGWWTEGLAFDFVSVIVWLLARDRVIRAPFYWLFSGVTLGLLCLDRSIFTILLPLICLLLAITQEQALSRRVSCALLILLAAVAIQSPWWIRNIALSHRLLPLGTQGGINLPDEYSDIAIEQQGNWTGKAMRDAWIPPQDADRAANPPPGYSPQSYAKLWANDPRAAALLVATYCTSLQSELAVYDTGKEAAMHWIARNPAKIPQLMLAKAWSLFRYKRAVVSLGVALGVIGYVGLPTKRRLLLSMATLVGIYVLGIMLTHVVYYRFMLPIFPPLYVGAALGIAAICGRMRERKCEHRTSNTEQRT
jgi:hypothetical protein